MNDIWQELFKATGLSVTAVSKETLVNRSSVNQMVNGTRHISEDVYNYILTLPISDNLKNKFSAVYIGKHFRHNYSDLLFYFFETSSKYDSEISLPEPVFPEMELKGDTVLHHSFFMQAISAVILDAAKNGRTVITNIPVKMPFFTDTVRGIYQHLDSKDFIHLIPTPVDINKECIDILWYCLHMAEEGINTFSVPGFKYSGLFPYCLTDGKTALVFDEEFRTGYSVTGPMAELFAGKLENIKSKAKPAGFFIEDDVDALSIENQYFSKSASLPLFVLDTFLCSDQWTKEQIVESAKDYLPEEMKSILADRFINFLGSMKSHNSYYTFEAIKNFAETGRIIQISDKYVHEAGKETRKAILESVQENKNARFIKQDFIKLPECFGIDWTGSVFSIFTGRNYIPGSHYSNRVAIPYNAINGMYEFFSYMIKWIDCCGLVEEEKRKMILNNYIISLGK